MSRRLLVTVKRTPGKRKANKSSQAQSINGNDQQQQQPIDNIPEDELCQICYTNRLIYKCSSCQCKVCADCLRTYIMDFGNGSPHCLQCQTLLPFDIIYKSFNGIKHGFDEFMKHCGNLKLELEKQKIPDVLECCSIIQLSRTIKEKMDESTFNNANKVAILGSFDEHENQYTSQTISDEQLDNITQFINTTLINASSHDESNDITVLSLFNDYFHNNRVKLTPEQQTKFVKFIDQTLKTVYHTNMEEMNIIAKNMFYDEQQLIDKYNRAANRKELGKSKGVRYLFRCSNGDCKGFVNVECICELCRAHYCKSCFKLLTEDEYENNSHECKEEDIATANELMANTKPCPKCASRIFKVSGCSQMFCTNCQTGFDWNTGKIINGEFHNPERLRWIQEHGGVNVHRNINGENGLCGIDENALRNDDYFMLPSLSFRLHQYRYITEIRHRNATKVDKYINNSFKQRCLYALNDLSEADYTKWCEKWEFTRHKTKMLIDIYTEFLETSRDLLISCYQKRRQAIDLFRMKNNLWLHFFEDCEYSGVRREIIDGMISNFNQTNDYSKLLDRLIMLCSKYKSLTDLCNELKKVKDEMIITSDGVSYNERKYLDEVVKCLSSMPKYDEELNVFNELTKHTNEQIDLYKKVFKVPKLTRPINEDDERSQNGTVYTTMK